MPISLYRLTALAALIFWIGMPDIHAQQPADARFGSIPDSLYWMQPPADNPDTPYMVTNKEMNVSFRETDDSIMAILEHHVRLKVFDKTAPDASVIAIPYYFENNMERISEIKAVTYLPSGEQTSLKEKDIRTININARYNVKEFTMPEVENGAILEYSYIIQRRYIEELPDFFLSENVPTKSAKVTITYPKYLRYKAIIEDYSGPIQHDFVYTDTSSVPKVFTIPQPQPVVTERWMAYDIPAVEEEVYISSIDDYRSKIKFLLSEFGIPRQHLENSWEVVVARIHRRTNPWPVITNNGFAETKGDSIARALSPTSKEVIQDSIYHFLNRSARFSGLHAPFSTEADTRVLAGKAADQAAINQTLVAMLHGADIEAYPVMISTRQSGKINIDFPSFYQFNAQIVCSHIGGQTYVMDASFPYSSPGLIPVDMYNSPGLVLKQDSFEWINFNPDKSLFDISVDIDAALRSDGTLEGTVNSQHIGYPAQLIRQQIADGMSEEEILNRTLFDGISQLTADTIEIKNLEDFGKPVEVSAHFEVENYAISFTEGLKFRPMIVGARGENPFKDTDRKFPITLDAPEKLNVSYSIELPEGFSISEGKQNRELSFPGAQFEEHYDMEQGKIKYEYHINIGQKEFSAEFFPQLYNLYQRWAELSNTAGLIEK